MDIPFSQSFWFRKNVHFFKFALLSSTTFRSSYIPVNLKSSNSSNCLNTQTACAYRQLFSFCCSTKSLSFWFLLLFRFRSSPEKRRHKLRREKKKYAKQFNNKEHESVWEERKTSSKSHKILGEKQRNICFFFWSILKWKKQQNLQSSNERSLPFFVRSLRTKRKTKERQEEERKHLRERVDNIVSSIEI